MEREVPYHVLLLLPSRKSMKTGEREGNELSSRPFSNETSPFVILRPRPPYISSLFSACGQRRHGSTTSRSQKRSGDFFVSCCCHKKTVSPSFFASFVRPKNPDSNVLLEEECLCCKSPRLPKLSSSFPFLFSLSGAADEARWEIRRGAELNLTISQQSRRWRANPRSRVFRIEGGGNWEIRSLGKMAESSPAAVFCGEREGKSLDNQPGVRRKGKSKQILLLAHKGRMCVVTQLPARACCHMRRIETVGMGFLLPPPLSPFQKVFFFLEKKIEKRKNPLLLSPPPCRRRHCHSVTSLGGGHWPWLIRKEILFQTFGRNSSSSGSYGMGDDTKFAAHADTTQKNATPETEFSSDKGLSERIIKKQLDLEKLFDFDF